MDHDEDPDPSPPRHDLDHRRLAMLRAVAAGRAQLSCSAEPDLFIDGVPCCDQYTAHLLSRDGLVAPARPGIVGQRVPARLTAAGRSVVATGHRVRTA